MPYLATTLALAVLGRCPAKYDSQVSGKAANEYLYGGGFRFTLTGSYAEAVLFA